jgi:sugar lactone lactonase YvrE|tara:strand:- start:15815 stop:16732 length:918 start_codon:yes stop_codon:yes gene_type:complete
MKNLTKRVEGIYFGEGPRWHENKLWFSDMQGFKVMTLDLDDKLETVCEIPNQPSGLGWLPSGDLLIVSMTDRKILKLSNGNLSIHADLSELVQFNCNDMVVSRNGTAYVGNFGMKDAQDKVKKTHLVIVKADGSVIKGPDELSFPNGTVISEDGKTLIVGETLAGKLTAFDINDEGLLINKRLWARTGSPIILNIMKFLRKIGITLQEKKGGSNFYVPDGICLDEKNGIWVASPTSSSVIRVEKGGKITDEIKTPKNAYACMLGGTERKTLYVMVADSSDADICRKNPTGAIYSAEVSIAGCGKP